MGSCIALFPKKDEPYANSEIEELVATFRQSFDAPGLAVGIIKDGEILYTGANGVQDLDSQSPLTTRSLFHMASVSKPFVATAVVQLVERGKIKLDDKLTEYLPYFTMADPRYEDITIRHMLSHSSGIPDEEDYEWDKPQYDEMAVERYARSFANESLDFAPGTEYGYSNPAFDILCAVIAQASGMTFEDYMQQHIFDPIGMVNSTFYQPEVSRVLATQPHVLGKDLQREVSAVYPYNRRHAGSSTLHSNVEDMLLWAQVYLNKGEINGRRIFSESSYELLTTAQNRDQDERRDIGLSWFLDDMVWKPIVYHQGGDLGYSTFFGYLPKEKAAIVLMANIDDFWSDYAASWMLLNVGFDRAIPWERPVQYVLKNYILKEGIEKTREVYFSLKEQTPEGYDFDGSQLDGLGFWLLDRGYAQEALDIFLFNIELEPKDAGWVDSVGDAYVALGDKEEAIAWYQKVLGMDPDQEFTRVKLEKLLGS
ncbi:MAG: serine hydrolase [Bacteroidota bacterium]